MQLDALTLAWVESKLSGFIGLESRLWGTLASLSVMMHAKDLQGFVASGLELVVQQGAHNPPRKLHFDQSKR